MTYDRNTLIEMMTYGRRHQGEGEKLFLKRFIDPIPGVYQDAVGNRIVRIGKANTLFSAHFDSVHNPIVVRQKPVLTGDIASKKDGHPLGADDATGCWILMNLIAANVPGLYIFHTGEECGGIGSSHIADKTPELLNGIDRAVAFDRRGQSDVITHQSGGRCCSDEFAEALAEALQMKHLPDPTGSFTDTANYTHLVPECTNVASGYEDEHTRRETQDLAYAEALCKACLELDWETLPTARDPSISEWDAYGGYADFYESDWHENYRQKFTYRDAEELIEENAYEIAMLLEGLGYDKKELQDYIDDLWGFNEETRVA